MDGWMGMLGGGGGVLLLWLAVAKDVKGSEWNRLRSELRDPPGLQDFLSTDVWTPGPFDQISILRSTYLGGPPRFPRHRNAMCPKMSQRLGVSRQTSPYLSSTSKHAKVHKASLKTTFTPLNNTNPSPTRHTHQDHSLPSHNPPSSSIPHQQYNPPSTHQNVPPSTTTSTTAIPLLPPRRTLRPHHPGPPHPGPRGTKPNQPKIPPTV